MKKIISLFAVAGLFALASCNNDDDKKTEPAPASTLALLEGVLTTRTLDPALKYLLRGQVFINNGVTVTIPAGTVILGEKRTKGTLVVNRGGKLEACGTANAPIVFTSNQETNERDKGDWGGIVIVGNANCNQNNPAIEGIEPAVTFGTFNSTASDGESSGSLCYVRVEYAGIALTPNNETNSITMGSVGHGTKMEYCQVSYGGDDGFEWFGGTINGKYLISFGTWDDDFDCDFGWIGNVQFGVVVRDPFQADQSGSNAFECDNDATGSSAAPKTAGVFSNITVFGPSYNGTFTGGSSHSGNYQHTIHFRRNTAVSIFNSIIGGFPRGLNLDGSVTQANYTNGEGVLANNILYAIGQRATPNNTGSGTYFRFANSASETYFNDPSRSNRVFWNRVEPAGTPDSAAILNGLWVLDSAGISRDVFMKARASDGPTFLNYPRNPTNLATIGATARIGATFTNPKLTTTLPANFFNTAVTYRGAFENGIDWTDNWSNFFPQGQQY